MDLEALVVDAFAQLGIAVTSAVDAPDGRVDLVIDPAGVNTAVALKHRSTVTDDVAIRLLAEGPASGAVLLIVGDRVTESARRIITSRRGGYYDLRGRLALRAAALVIDVEVEPVTVRADRSDALSGRAGLEVATALLMEPQREFAVRELGRALGRSPGTVSEILAALRREGLIDSKNLVLDAQLFWRVEEHWAGPPTLLTQLPSPGDATLSKALRLGLDGAIDGAGWALTDTAAAVAYGAPMAIRSGQLLDFFVPDETVARRAATLLGIAASASRARAAVRVAPVPAAAGRRVEVDTNPTEWPLAHPLFVALDLAQDSGRGREILDAWTPDGPWTRVW